MRVVQVVPEITVGSGVEAVAYHLEKEWQQLGVDCERFTLAEAHGAWLGRPGPGIRGKLVGLARVVWFSTVGSVEARRHVARRDDDCIVICHNDAVVGDVYVNHGVVVEAMRARGGLVWRLVRNPLHLFTWVRDAVRYATGVHRVVVNLTSTDRVALARSYPRIRPECVVIGNGVDIRRYRPDPQERKRMREELRLGPDDRVALFVGHEFGRKGLPIILAGLRQVPDVTLLVVGGTSDLVKEAAREAVRSGVRDRVRFIGAVTDPRPYFHASDVFVFPSAYESYGLVVLEALACGVPVVATAVGCVPDVVVPGRNGAIVEPDPESVAEGIRSVLVGDTAAQAAAARASAERHAWSAVAAEYLELFEVVHSRRHAAVDGSERHVPGGGRP